MLPLLSTAWATEVGAELHAYPAGLPLSLAGAHEVIEGGAVVVSAGVNLTLRHDWGGARR